MDQGQSYFSQFSSNREFQQYQQYFYNDINSKIKSQHNDKQHQFLDGNSFSTSPNKTFEQIKIKKLEPENDNISDPEYVNLDISFKEGAQVFNSQNMKGSSEKNNSPYMKKSRNMRSIQHSLNQSSLYEKQQQLQSSREKQEKKYQNLYKNWDFYKMVFVLKDVRSFIKCIKNIYYGSQKVKSLNEKQLNRIGDIAYPYQNQEEEERQKRKLQLRKNIWYRCIVRILTIMPIIQPNQNFKIISDCWQSGLVLYRMFFTSVKLFFFLNDIRASIDLININILMIINFSFIFDMFLSLHTGYYEKGTIVSDRKKIAKKYLSSTFISDIFAQIPLLFNYYVNQDSDHRVITISYFLEFLIFLKSFSLVVVYKRLERVITENEFAAAIWPLVTLCVQIIILAHIVALFYYGSALLQIVWWDEDNTWVQARGYSERGWLDTYLHAVYWSFQTMVSNSLYEPTTRSDTLYSVIAIMAMTGIFGYVLNTIGMILEDLERKSKIYKQERGMTNRFMKKRQLPQPMRERITLYQEYLQDQEKQRNKEEEEKVLKRLSDQLRNEVLYYINKKNIEMFPCIFENFSQECQNQTMLVIKENLYSPGENIYKQGQHEFDKANRDSLAIYVVQKGIVEIYQIDPQGKQFVVAEIEEGGIFGNYEFFTGQARIDSARSKEAVNVIKIERTNFLNIIEKTKQDYETFCMIKDQILQYNTSKFNKIFCYICEEQGHLTHKCPTTNLNINVKELIYDYNHFNLNINRVQFERQEFKSHNALNENEDIVEAKHEVFRFDDETTEAALQLQQELFTPRERSQSFRKEQFINHQQYTSSSNIQSQDAYLNSLVQIEEENSQDLEQSLKSPFEFYRQVSRNPKQRRSSIMTKLQQYSEQQDSSHTIATPSRKQQRASILQTAHQQQNLLQALLQQNMAQIPAKRKPSILVENEDQQQQSMNLLQSLINQGLDISKFQSNQDPMNSSSRPSRVSKNIRQKKMTIPGVSGGKPLKEEKNKLTLQNQVSGMAAKDKQMVEDYDSKYLDNNFEKMKNWSAYWTIHNFEYIRNSDKMKKYFKFDEYIKTEESQNSRNSFFNNRRKGQMYDTGIHPAANNQKHNSHKGSNPGTQRSKMEFSQSQNGQTRHNSTQKNSFRFNNVNNNNNNNKQRDSNHSSMIELQKSLSLKNPQQNQITNSRNSNTIDTVSQFQYMNSTEDRKGSSSQLNNNSQLKNKLSSKNKKDTLLYNNYNEENIDQPMTKRAESHTQQYGYQDSNRTEADPLFCPRNNNFNNQGYNNMDNDSSQILNSQNNIIEQISKNNTQKRE